MLHRGGIGVYSRGMCLYNGSKSERFILVGWLKFYEVNSSTIVQHNFSMSRYAYESQRGLLMSQSCIIMNVLNTVQ